jgi:hypothetical protein
MPELISSKLTHCSGKVILYTLPKSKHIMAKVVKAFHSLLGFLIKAAGSKLKGSFTSEDD